MSSNNLRAPALSWDAMLNMKKIGLELISDAGMYFVFEKDMSGGVFTFLKDIVKPTIII